ncbi:MAG: HNH endonuclease [Gemmatimonadaceae bacterium]|nr:HNH endonuclease [Gemmatimonadaceae bacterium]
MQDRFWSKVKKEEGGCWTWQASTNRGYGLFRVDHRKPMAKVHRLSYEWVNGPVPRGLVVMHSCDNKRCVNPAHLTAGPQHENVRQAVARGLFQRGVEKPQHKLTEAQVREIRARTAAGESMAKLALEFGVSSPTVQSIVHLRKWRHVA